MVGNNSNTSGSDTNQPHFNTAPSVLASKFVDGGEYIVISRGRQSSEPQMWSTGDKEQTQQLFQQVARSQNLETTA